MYSTPKIDATVIVNAPRSFVFAQVSNSENYPKMVSSYKSVRRKGKEREWSIYEVETEVFGSKSTGIQRRRSHPEDMTEDFYESDMASVHGIITLEEVPEGTKLRLQMDMQFKGALAKMLGPFVSGRMKKGVEDTKREIKEYLEAAAPKM